MREAVMIKERKERKWKMENERCNVTNAHECRLTDI